MADKPDYRKIIEDSRKSGTIIPSKFFENSDARAALSQLTKEDTAAAAAKKAQNKSVSEMASDEQKRNKKAGLSIPQFKKGGMVKKTGIALVHKGEKVLTKKQAKKGPRKRA